jgi:hypothetical protein
MSADYRSFCDDFFVNMRLGSQMPLPKEREPILLFFEQVQKAFPTITRFRRSESEHTIEEERGSNSYRWVSVEHQRLASGHVNPPSVSEAMKLHRFVLELAPYQLNISPVEIDYLDVLFGFDLEYRGNHDEIIAEGLFHDSPLGCLLEEIGARAVDFQPSVTVALSEDCRLQGRIDLVTRTSTYQVRTGNFSGDVISVYLFVRRFWGDRPKQSMLAMLGELVDRCEDLADKYVLPRIVRPLQAAISSRS